MIHRLRIQNFKCLQDVSLELGPLTVLIGPNDSGKSSILEAIHWLGTLAPEKHLLGEEPPQPEATQRTDADNDKDKDDSEPATVIDPTLETLIWRRDLSRRFLWAVKGSIGGKPFAYELGLSPVDDQSEEHLTVGNKRYRSRPSPLQRRAVREALLATDRYYFYPHALQLNAPPEPSPVLSPDGRNLAAVLDALLTGPDRETAVALERAIRETVPTIRGIALRTVPAQISEKAKTNQFLEALMGVMDERHQGPVKALEFVLAGKERPPVVIPVTQVSDGALLMTAFLALAYSDTPGILLIEEPENGFHPSRMKEVVELLRRMTRGELGNRSRQIILTTHSPILLNFLEPTEVRIVRRVEGATEVTAMDQAPNIGKLLEEFAIGELWYLLKEDGLLKGHAP